MLDSALATLGIPVYRVPGNHDINDPVTRDVFFQRYGRYPQVVDMAGIRFVLLNSTYVPPDGPLKGTHRPYIGGVPIDSAQVAFLQSALAEGQPYRRAFVFTHHVLWWKQDAPWWTTVHPVLRDRRVAGVFAGDYGPMKFSHAVRDSIDYIQSTVENLPGIRILQRIEASRLLYQQFDNFLHVTVRGTDVDIDVKVLGAMEGGKFTPERFQQITSYEPTVKERLRTMFGSSKRIAALIVSVLAVFAVGAFTGSMWRARRA